MAFRSVAELVVYLAAPSALSAQAVRGDLIDAIHDSSESILQAVEVTGSDTPNFVKDGDIGGQIVPATNGAIFNCLTPGTAQFNHPEDVYSSNPQMTQLVLKPLFQGCCERFPGTKSQFERSEF